MINPEFVETNRLTDADKLQVMKLWNQEYPVKLAFESLNDFEKYYNGLHNASHILLKDYDHFLGWGVKFEREQARWFAIILSSSSHKQGVGSKMLNQLKEGETELNGWVVDHNTDFKANDEPYLSPLGFYLKQGFELISNERLELPTLSAVKIVWRKNKLGK